MKRMKLFLFLSLFLSAAAQANPFVDAFQRLGPLELGSGPTQWKAVSFVPLFDARFPTYHPQGIKLIGSTLFLTTVQTKAPGAGHLNRYALDSVERPRMARALGRLTFPSGPGGLLIHAGGLDGDATKLYVPLAAYRAEGPAEIVQIEPRTLAYRAVAWLNDHVGTLAYGKDERAFHLVDWGTGLYSIPFDSLDFLHEITLHAAKHATGSDWEYQDCKSVGDSYAICSAKRGTLWPAGEIHLVRFRNGSGGEPELEVVHRIAVPSPRGDGSPGGSRPLTYNAMDFALVYSKHDPGVVVGMRFYFVPYDDEESHLMAFEASL